MTYLNVQSCAQVLVEIILTADLSHDNWIMVDQIICFVRFENATFRSKKNCCFKFTGTIHDLFPNSGLNHNINGSKNAHFAFIFTNEGPKIWVKVVSFHGGLHVHFRFLLKLFKNSFFPSAWNRHSNSVRIHTNSEGLFLAKLLSTFKLIYYKHFSHQNRTRDLEKWSRKSTKNSVKNSLIRHFWH